MATAANRGFVLDPTLQRIGFGCAHDLGRGWRCVLDVNSGRGDPRPIVYPAPNQNDVPTIGFESVPGAHGFPIGVIFPRQANLRNPQASLKDADQKDVAIQTSILDKPQPIVSVRPTAPLQPGHTYSITIAVIN